MKAAMVSIFVFLFVYAILWLATGETNFWVQIHMVYDQMVSVYNWVVQNIIGNPFWGPN